MTGKAVNAPGPPPPRRPGGRFALFFLPLILAACSIGSKANPDATDRELLVTAARRAGISAEPGRVSARVEEIRSTPGLADSLYPGVDPGEIPGRVRDDLAVEAYLDRMIRGRVQISDAEMEKYMAERPEEFAGKSLDDVKDRLYPYMRDQQARAAIEAHLRRLRSGDWRMTRG